MSFSKEAQAVLDHISESAGIDPFTFDDQGRTPSISSGFDPIN
jgi:hypothetical protein